MQEIKLKLFQLKEQFSERLTEWIQSARTINSIRKNSINKLMLSWTNYQFMTKVQAAVAMYLFT